MGRLVLIVMLAERYRYLVIFTTAVPGIHIIRTILPNTYVPVYNTGIYIVPSTVYIE